MKIPLYQVDAFTSRPFDGNPAAVCLLTEPMADDWMQSVAAEMNLSETAFLFPESDGYRLRWFTPTVEVDLCGHATLASAHILWERGLLKSETARFYTRSGLLTAKRKDGWIELNFPAEPESEIPAPPELARALGVEPRYVGRNRFDVVAELDSEEALRSLAPDLALIAAIPARGIIVTSRSSSPEYDFIARFFAPQSGVPEDPVTGSAYCGLGPYWASRLQKQSFTAYQASRRGGEVKVQLHGERVLLSGQAVTVFAGEWVGAIESK